MDDPVVERAQRRRYIDPAQDAKFVVHGPSCRRSFSYQHTRLRQSSLKRRDEVNPPAGVLAGRSEEHTSELQSLMRITYAVFCLKKKTRRGKGQTNYKHKLQISTKRAANDSLSTH